MSRFLRREAPKHDLIGSGLGSRKMPETDIAARFFHAVDSALAIPSSQPES